MGPVHWWTHVSVSNSLHCPSPDFPILFIRSPYLFPIFSLNRNNLFSEVICFSIRLPSTSESGPDPNSFRFLHTFSLHRGLFFSTPEVGDFHQDTFGVLWVLISSSKSTPCNFAFCRKTPLNPQFQFKESLREYFFLVPAGVDKNDKNSLVRSSSPPRILKQKTNNYMFQLVTFCGNSTFLLGLYFPGGMKRFHFPTFCAKSTFHFGL